MLAALRDQGADEKGRAAAIPKGDAENRVFNVLKRRLHMSQTFAENLIFMLNRASKRVQGATCVAFSPADQAGVRRTSACNCWC